MDSESICVTKSDPPIVKIEKSEHAMYQNLGMGILLTVAYLNAPLVGINDFSTNMYGLLMAAGFGLVNLPKRFGMSAGSVGIFAFIPSMAKIIPFINWKS